jgi:enamine deaminase RidA (YjgF/YER057c/UK114 family)
VSVELHNPDAVGAPLGRYTHVASATGSRTVVVAGQVGVDRDGRIEGDGGIAAQTRRTYANIEACLASAGAGWGDVVKMSVFLVSEDLIDGFFAARDEVFAGAFPDAAYPPSTLVIVRRLVRPELLVEIEATAVTD